MFTKKALILKETINENIVESYFINLFSVFWICLDPKLFDLKDQDPKLLISDPEHHLLRKISLKIFFIEGEQIHQNCTQNTLLEKFKKLKISTHFCLHIKEILTFYYHL